MTISESLNWASQKLHRTSLSPILDSEVLLSFAIKKNKAWVYAHSENNLTKKPSNNFLTLIEKRTNHWPVAYLTGHKEFFGLDFKITKDVLTPRPETEMLVELALARIAYRKSHITQVVDIGTGSGNIIISIAKSLVQYGGLVHHTPKLTAVDTSKKALKIARQNARKHHVLKKIKFLRGNLLSPLRNTKYLIRNTLLVANLPYLTAKQMTNLTIKREPQKTLYGGKDGLKYFKELFKQASEFEIRNSKFLLEHDPSQKNALTKLAKTCFPRGQVKFQKDLAHNYRVLEIIF